MTHSLVWKQTHVINELQFDLSHSNSDRLAVSVSYYHSLISLTVTGSCKSFSLIQVLTCTHTHVKQLMLSNPINMHNAPGEKKTPALQISPEWSFIYRGLFTQIGDALSLSQVWLIHCLDLSGSGEGEQRISPLVMRILLHLWLHSFILCTRGQFVPPSQHPSLCSSHLCCCFPSMRAGHCKWGLR